jgi:hypothetical protein
MMHVTKLTATSVASIFRSCKGYVLLSAIIDIYDQSSHQETQCNHLKEHPNTYQDHDEVTLYESRSNESFY